MWYIDYIDDLCETVTAAPPIKSGNLFLHVLSLGWPSALRWPGGYSRGIDLPTGSLDHRCSVSICFLSGTSTMTCKQALANLLEEEKLHGAKISHLNCSSRS